MMGRQATKRELFVMISLDEYVPEDHLLRAVDRYLDLSELGDTNYGVAAMLGWLVDQKRIAPHVPVWDKSEHHDGTFSRADSFSTLKTTVMFARPAST